MCNTSRSIYLLDKTDQSHSKWQHHPATTPAMPYQGIEVSESKFWRKVKKDPVVPIGTKSSEKRRRFIFILFARRNGRIRSDCHRCDHRFQPTRSKQTNLDLLVNSRRGSIIFSLDDRLVCRIRTRVFAQGFVVSLMTAAAIYHAVKDKQVPTDIHGHPLNGQKALPSPPHHQSQQQK